MKRIITIAAAVVLLLAAATPALAQLKSSAAILPIQGNRPLDRTLVKQVGDALAAPLEARAGYSVTRQEQSAGRIAQAPGKVTNEAYMLKSGQSLEVDQVVACYVEVAASASPSRMNFSYVLAYFDVRGREMMATTRGTCQNCRMDELAHRMGAQITNLYAGPYPFGLDTDPSGATVYHEGEEWGTTPIRRILPGGSYTIRLEKPGYKAFEVQFPMPDDRPVYATLPLKKDPDYVPPAAAIVAPIVTPRGPQTETPPVVKAPPAEPKPGPPAPVTRADRGPQVAEPEKPATPRGPERGPQVAEPDEPGPERGPQVAEPEEPSPPQIEPAPSAVNDGMSLRRKWAWRTVGLAVAFAAGGGGLTIAGVHSDDRAADASLLPTTRAGYADRADVYWISAYTMYGLAAAATTTALILFFTEPERNDGPAVSVSPAFSPEGVGIAAGVRY